MNTRQALARACAAFIWSMLIWSTLIWTFSAAASTLPPDSSQPRVPPPVVAIPAGAQPASGVPAAAPAPDRANPDKADQDKADPDDGDLDAALGLHPQEDRRCDFDKDFAQQVFTYDYTGGTVWEDQFQPGYPLKGRETGHRLYVGCGFGVMYEHLSSSLPNPDGTAMMDTLAAVMHMDQRVFTVAFGIGATHYRTPQQSYTLATIPLLIRRQIVWGLSGEVNTTIPLGGLFTSYQFAQDHPNDPALNNVWEAVLRYDWKNVGLRFGRRSYQIGYTPAGSTQQYAIRRSGAFAGVSFKF